MSGNRRSGAPFASFARAVGHETGDADAVVGEDLLAHRLVPGHQQGQMAASRCTDTPPPRAFPEPDTRGRGSPCEGLDGVEDKVGAGAHRATRPGSRDRPDTQQVDLVAAAAERVGDLVLHLRLVVFPRRDFGGHLPLVVGMIPPAVGRIEHYRNAHDGSGLKATESCAASGERPGGAGPLREASGAKGGMPADSTVPDSALVVVTQPRSPEVTMEFTAREARLKQEFADLYPPARSGIWETAAEMGAKVLLWQVQQQGTDAPTAGSSRRSTSSSGVAGTGVPRPSARR